MILLAVPDLDRYADVLHREAPRLDEREVVVAPAVHALSYGFTHALGEVLPELGREDSSVDVRQEGAKPLQEALGSHGLTSRPEVFLERLAPLPRRRELLEVRLTHPGEPIEPVGVDRRHGPERGNRRDAVREQRGARKGMGPPAGDAPDGEPLDLERVRDRAHICGGIRHRPVRRCGRAAVAGTVVRHESNATLLGVTDVGLEQQPGHRRSLLNEDDGALAGTRLVEAQRPTVRPCNVPHCVDPKTVETRPARSS